MAFTEILGYGFIQRALVAGTLIAVLCSVLGVFLVLRRLSLIGDGLAHVTFGSVALALFLRVNPLFVTVAAIPLVLLSSLGILRLTDRARLYGDAAIGIVSSLGIAAGVILASVAGGFNIDLFSYLFGNILAVSTVDLLVAGALFLFVVLVVSLFYHDLFAITFDEELAESSGINTGAINTLLVLVTALSVVLAMKVVGIMLVSSLLIIPAVSALQVAHGFRSAILLSALFAAGAVVAGIFGSIALNLPAGASIVAANFLVLAAVFLCRKLRPLE